jgi:hypothetical protein
MKLGGALLKKYAKQRTRGTIAVSAEILLVRRHHEGRGSFGSTIADRSGWRLIAMVEQQILY